MASFYALSPLCVRPVLMALFHVSDRATGHTLLQLLASVGGDHKGAEPTLIR